MSNTCRRCLSNRWEWSDRINTFYCTVCHYERDYFYQRWEFDRDRSLLRVSKCVDREAIEEFVPVAIPYLSHQLYREINSITRLIITRLIFEVAPHRHQMNTGEHWANDRLLIDGTEIFADVLEGRISHDFGGMHSIRLTMQIAPAHLAFDSSPYHYSIAISCHPVSSRSHPRYHPLSRFMHSAAEQMVVGRQDWLGVDYGEPLPSLNKSAKPKACVGCTNYHGSSYGGNLLICGIHPYGYDGDQCPDHSEAESEPSATVSIDTEIIRQRLGLEHFHHFAIGRDFGRQSGRTTRMICEALAAVDNGHTVLIVVATEDYARSLRPIVVDYVNRLNLVEDYLHPLNLSRARIWISSNPNLLRGSGHRVFRDHVVEGQL